MAKLSMSSKVPSTISDGSAVSVRGACFALRNGCLSSEKAAFFECVRSACYDVDVDIRVLVASLLCDTDLLHEDLVSLLMHDEFKVAYSVLKHYKNISSLDLHQLIAVVRNLDKMKVIATRVYLAESVIADLILYGDADCVSLLLRNRGLVFTKDNVAAIRAKYSHDKAILGLLGEVVLASNSNLKGINYIKRFINGETEGSWLFSEAKNKNSTVDALMANNQLQYTTILHFLCKADLYSFARSIMKYNDIPYKKIKEILLGDNIRASFRELYYNAQLPSALYDDVCDFISNILSIKSSDDYVSYIRSAIAKENKYSNNMRYLLHLAANQ